MESRSASVGDPVVSFYNKTLSSREFTDYGAINLGQSCPIATTDQEAEDNKLEENKAKGEGDMAEEIKKGDPRK